MSVSAPQGEDFLARHLRDVPPFRALIRAIECRLFAELGELKRPVLDLGCGDGHFAAMAFDSPLEVGIDLDSTSTREARDRRSHRLIMQASASAIPASDETFATVVSNCVVEHIADLAGTLGEVHRVLRPGGRFAFGVPSHQFADLLLGSTALRAIGLDRLGDRYGQWFNAHSRHFHTYHPDAWIKILEAHRFGEIRWQYYGTPAGHRAFDIAHYLSVPNLLSYKLTGKWVLWHNSVAMRTLYRWLRPHYLSACASEGAYIFFDCRKC